MADRGPQGGDGRGGGQRDATPVPQSRSQVWQPRQRSGSWRSCSLPHPEGRCFASKTCKSSCRSCWPAGADRALVAGGVPGDGSLSSKVSGQCGPPADFLHHTLAQAFSPHSTGLVAPSGGSWHPRSPSPAATGTERDHAGGLVHDKSGSSAVSVERVDNF